MTIEIRILKWTATILTLSGILTFYLDFYPPGALIFKKSQKKMILYYCNMVGYPTPKKRLAIPPSLKKGQKTPFFGRLSYPHPTFFQKKNSFGNIEQEQEEKIISGMWSNMGRTFAEYVFLKDFKFNKTDLNHMKINGSKYLNEIKSNYNEQMYIYKYI